MKIKKESLTAFLIITFFVMPFLLAASGEKVVLKCATKSVASWMLLLPTDVWDSSEVRSSRSYRLLLKCSITKKSDYHLIFSEDGIHLSPLIVKHAFDEWENVFGGNIKIIEFL